MTMRKATRPVTLSTATTTPRNAAHDTQTRMHAHVQQANMQQQRPSIDDAHEHRGYPQPPPVHVIVEKAVDAARHKLVHARVQRKKPQSSVEVSREPGSDGIFHISVQRSRGQWTASADDEEVVMLGRTSDQLEPIQQEKNDPLKFQVVIDKVGHGVAPDQPRLEPQLAELSPQASHVTSKASLSTARHSVDKTLGLALAGVVVLLVAVVVTVFARRQQRKYEKEQQHQSRRSDDNNAVEDTSRQPQDADMEHESRSPGRKGETSPSDNESVEDCWV